MNVKDYMISCGTVRCLEGLLDSVADENLCDFTTALIENLKKDIANYHLVPTKKMRTFNVVDLTEDEIFRMTALKIRQMMLLNPQRKEELKKLDDFVKTHRLHMKMKGK